MSLTRRDNTSHAGLPSTGAASSTTTHSNKMSNAFDAFAAVDEVVSKPVLGSDGAASWQLFQHEVRHLDHHVSTAPKAPLKKADKLGTGLTSWEEERQHEAQLKQQAGVGEDKYVHFKQKNGAEEAAKRKEIKRIEQRIRPNDKEYYVAAGTFQGYRFDYVFTTRDWGTGYYWDGMDSLKQLQQRGGEGELSLLEPQDQHDEDADVNLKKKKRKQDDDLDNSTAAPKLNEEKKKKRKQGSKNDGPVFVNDPNNPMEQVANALQRRHAQQQQQQMPFALSTSLIPLPSGWETATDPTTNRMYYFCRTTGQRQWDIPTLVAMATPTVTAATTNGNSDQLQQESSTTAAPATTAMTDDLPEGWNLAKDPTTGKDYFFHTDGTTTWERPKKSSST
jgi:hypothetical protein